MSKKVNFDWASIQEKVDGVLGNDFWQDLNRVVPKRTACTDFYENETEGYLVVELPGLRSQEDLNIVLEANQLVLEGNIPYTYPIEKEALKMNERLSGPFKKVIHIPFQYSPDEVKAEYRHGLLEIRLVKMKKTKPITISFTEENHKDPS
ncbi:Hsp20/alpha crystallin family protein [Fictibacillus sp. WQ 8-8]|uniref:Hsp20/alpha crystallin family protein n=1 Tax=Fictibacillus sp. WQ 8-8 TaxID=2938788 RepID=UPI00210DB94C|nr:Hsp20/alpha crystallin family protein [Fictibacillus sp. WQ 8-8]MCQ6266752.1 Hsp20/alpha crystallin family protein [Fictibacillus sp. WQ 8-8]